MGINFFLKNNRLKSEREQYVKEFKVDDIKIEPCGKFVACLEKLSKNYVLALRDNTSIETLQVANQNDIEFYEGYEIATAFTDDLRKKLCISMRRIYWHINDIVEMINKLERIVDNENKDLLNDIKLDFNVTNGVILNIFQHLTMTNEIPVFNTNGQYDLKNIIERLKELMLETLKEIIDVNSKIAIDYISRQIELAIEKIILYYNQVVEILKK